jgi:methanogenic corrinoid protein MtbC1
MLVAHGNSPAQLNSRHDLIEAEDITSLAPIAIEEAAHVLLERVETIMQRGVSVEEIFVSLLAPVARHLGQEWEEDRLDFLQVSMALWRLQEVLRQVSANTTQGSLDQPRSALFAPMPGEQHSFGTAMVHECFTLAGWDADLLLEASLQRLIEMVAEHHYDLLGLTLSCDCNNERLASLIRAVRSVSKNSNICVMIGGRVPSEHPEMVALSGADGTAESAPAAVDAAERMVGLLRLAATA